MHAWVTAKYILIIIRNNNSNNNRSLSSWNVSCYNSLMYRRCSVNTAWVHVHSSEQLIDNDGSSQRGALAISNTSSWWRHCDNCHCSSKYTPFIIESWQSFCLFTSFWLICTGLNYRVEDRQELRFRSHFWYLGYIHNRCHRASTPLKTGNVYKLPTMLTTDDLFSE